MDVCVDISMPGYIEKLEVSYFILIQNTHSMLLIIGLNCPMVPRWSKWHALILPLHLTNLVRIKSGTGSMLYYVSGHSARRVPWSSCQPNMGAQDPQLFGSHVRSSTPKQSHVLLDWKATNHPKWDWYAADGVLWSTTLLRRWLTSSSSVEHNINTVLAGWELYLHHRLYSRYCSDD